MGNTMPIIPVAIEGWRMRDAAPARRSSGHGAPTLEPVRTLKKAHHTTTANPPKTPPAMQNSKASGATMGKPKPDQPLQA